MSTAPVEQQPPPPSLPAETYDYLQWLFAFHGLTIRQKVLSIAQKYYVNDDQGQPRFFVVRPPKIGMYLVAGVAGLSIRILFLFLAFRLIFHQNEFFLALVVFIIGGWLSQIVSVLIRPYRDIRVYTDDTEQFQVLLITQDNKFGFFHWFTVFDPLGQPIARARRNLVVSIFRRQWLAITMDGRPIVKVREDSWVLAILRRYLGPLWGALRTNFDFVLPDGTRIGEYNRKLTLTDQYLLSLHQDVHYLVDRRVALAIAILLDTAEGR